MNTNTYANFRADKEDLAKLKIIAALLRESMLHTFKRLVQQEYDRLHLSDKGASPDATVQENQA